MKIYDRSLAMLLVLSGIPSTLLAHPYDSPFTFKMHKTSDGNTVFSNIPLSCFKSGLMTCWHYNPVAGKSEHKLSTPQSSATTEINLASENPGGLIKLSVNGICHEPGDNSYDKTEVFKRFNSMDECINQGGRPAKR